MKKLIIAFCILAVSGVEVFAQGKYFSREGKIQFFSKAPMEDIEAINRKATAVLDTETGKLEFSVLMKAFEFEKALMMEHFNENYVESNKFPKAIFKGSVSDASAVKWDKDGSYPVTVKGTMELHGVTKDVEAPGTFLIKDGKLNGKSEFNLNIKDYNIQIPSVVKDKIAEVVKITVDINYEPLKK
jgi:polyisoprenoid-binding protein YceI